MRPKSISFSLSIFMPKLGKKKLVSLYRNRSLYKDRILGAKKRFVEKIRFLLKETAYWGSVVTIGVLISGVIGQVGFDLPLFPTASAITFSEGLAIFIGNIFYIFFSVLIFATALLAYILEIILLYPYGDPSIFPAWQGNGFVNVDQVKIGWKLVRDICNIFFALILVIIALASVLKIEAYSWKQLLPKFFIAAILINFSKSIAGIFTDLGTVIMATFSSSFTGTFSRALIGGFGLPVLGDMTPLDTGPNVDKQVDGSGFFSVILAYIAAFVMVGVFFVLIAVFTATLFFRVIMLWFLIVLSPIAYITRILPVTQKYSSQWWEMFGRYVLVGPLVTFFLWLSLTMAFGGSTQTQAGSGFNNSNPITQGIAQASSTTAKNANITQAPSVGNFQSTNPNVLANFILATMMLLTSLKLINQMAQEFGSVLGEIQGTAQSLALRAAEKAGEIATVVGAQAGVAPAKDKDGNLQMGSLGYYIGRGTAVLGSTLGQPLTFLKQATDNLKASSAGKQQAARVVGMQAVAALRNEDTLGRGFLAGLSGAASNIVGVAAGAGMQDGKVVWDNYLSGSGLKRGVRLMWAAPGLMRKAKDEETKIKTSKDEIKKESEKLSEREAIDEAERLGVVASKAGFVSKFAQALGTDKDLKKADPNQVKQILFDPSGNLNVSQLDAIGTLDMGDSQIANFIQGHIEDILGEAQFLKANGNAAQGAQLEDQAKALQDRLNKKDNTLTIGKFMELGAGRASLADGYKNPADKKVAQLALFDELRAAVTDQARSLANEEKNIKISLENTGYKINDTTKAIETVGKDFRNDEKLKAAKEELARAEAARTRFLTELAAMKGDDRYETHVVQQKQMNEALKSLDGIIQPRQLIERFYQAKGSNDSMGMWAALKRLSQTGNLNDFFQGYLSVNADGSINKNAASDAQALFASIESEFGSLLDNRTKNEIKNDLSIDAFTNGEYDRALGISYLGGELHVLAEEDRQAAVINQARKQRPRDLAGRSRFAFFSEDGMGNMKDLTIGKALIASGGGELANNQVFPNIQAAALQTLSRPEVIDQLIEAGAPEDFINQLRKWARSTRKAYSSINRGSSRLRGF